MTTNIRKQVAYKNWGWMAARGVVAVLLGLLVLFGPARGLAALVMLFATILLVDGIATLIGAFSGEHRAGGSKWPSALAGVAGIGAALITFTWPQITVGILMLIVAFWALIRGALELVAYMELRNAFQGSWLLGLSGLMTFAFGVILVVWPAVGLSMLVAIVGVYAIAVGIVFLGLASQMRQALGAKERDADVSGPRRPSDPTPA